MSRKPTFSKNDLQSFVREKFTPLAGELQPLVEGMESQALWFEADGRHYVLRVRDSSEGFVNEAYAYRHFASARIPIPEVIRIGLTEIYASTLNADWDNLKWVTRRSREILSEVKRL